MEKLEKIYKHKKHDVATFLGSGPSINNITDEQWKIISDKTDVWAVNYWLYHPFVPDFYHVEVKSYNRKSAKKTWASRSDDYKDCVFVINQDREYLLDIIGEKQYIYLYKMNKINRTQAPIIPKYMPETDPNVLTCNLISSVTMLMELMWRFKYEKVIFFGIDMTNSRYFWTGKPEFGETHCQWNKDHEGRKPNAPHNTAHIKNFMVWFSQKRMAEFGGEFFVGHKDTGLYPDLRYIDIEKELS